MDPEKLFKMSSFSDDEKVAFMDDIIASACEDLKTKIVELTKETFSSVECDFKGRMIGLAKKPSVSPNQELYKSVKEEYQSKVKKLNQLKETLSTLESYKTENIGAKLHWYDSIYDTYR